MGLSLFTGMQHFNSVDAGKVVYSVSFAFLQGYVVEHSKIVAYFMGYVFNPLGRSWTQGLQFNRKISNRGLRFG